MKLKKILFIALAMLFSVSMTSNVYAFEACDTVSQCDAELAQLSEDIKNAEAAIEESRKSENDLRDQIEAHNEKILLTTQQIETLESTIDTLEKDIIVKEEEIAAKDEIIISQLQVQQKQQNSNTFLSLLFSSNSISDFMKRWSVIETLSGKEKEILDEFIKIKSELEADKQKQQEQKQSLEQTKINLADSKTEKERLMGEVQSMIEQQEAELDAYSSSAADIENQREILNQPPPTTGGGGSGGSTPSNGSWYLPVDAGAYVTTHYLQMYEYSSTPHLGADIASYSNAPIYSIADGYVLAAGWYGMFGNLVAVGHVVDGTYYVSLYGHMNYLNVGVGQYVYGGNSVLGGMGNTGYSFGTHLHIELAYRDYFTVNKSVRTSTNLDPLSKINWRAAYYDIS